MFVFIFIGFAPTYYLAGLTNAPLPSRIVHFHGAVFSLWMILLVVQTSLVATRRVQIHRQLGVAGFLLALAMLVLGLAAAANALGRQSSPRALDPKVFFVVPVFDILIFGTLILFAFLKRNDAAAHKRLILIATTALLTAGTARWRIAPVFNNVFLAMTLTYIFPVALMIYDFWSTGRVQRVTIWATVFLVAAQWLRFPLAQTHAWNAFASWVQSLAR